MNKEKLFDSLIIIASAVLMMIIIWFEVEAYYIQFSVIPLISFYFVGKYAQKKFGAASDAVQQSESS
ncbi:MAG TPA: hypothetical protein VK106_00150 [Balneolaceae bacterium]|nr:hypothetical protein [Balneolaceae bacterium]